MEINIEEIKEYELLIVKNDKGKRVDWCEKISEIEKK